MAPITVALAGFIVLLGACDPPPRQSADLVKTERSPSERRPAYENSQLSAEDRALVVAKIGDESFTLAEYERRLNSQAPFARSRYNSIARKRDFLENMVQFEVLADEAKRLGYDRDPEVILSMKRAMVRKLVADKVGKTIHLEDISDSEIDAYYQQNKADYVRPEKVRTSQIVLDDQESAQKLIAELEEEFKKRPNKRRRIFAAKARKVSIDKVTGELGGDMRFYARPEDGGTVPKVVADVAFGLERVGQLSEPFEVDGQWRVLILTAKKAKFERSVEDVKRNIANRLYRERKTEAERQYMAKIRTEASVEIHEDVLAKIPDPKPGSASDKAGLADPHGGRQPADFKRVEPKPVKTEPKAAAPKAVEPKGADPKTIEPKAAEPEAAKPKPAQ